MLKRNNLVPALTEILLHANLEKLPWNEVNGDGVCKG